MVVKSRPEGSSATRTWAAVWNEQFCLLNILVAGSLWNSSHLLCRVQRPLFSYALYGAFTFQLYLTLIHSNILFVTNFAKYVTSLCQQIDIHHRPRSILKILLLKKSGTVY